MLPALPTGMQSASRPPSRSSCISNAAVFWPSMRNSLIELTSTIGCDFDQLANELECLVEIARQRDDPGAVDQCLGHLAFGDLAVGDDHRTGDARARRVSSGAAGGVAGGGANHRLRAVAHRRRDGTGHAAILERAGWVGALQLEAHAGAHHLREHGRAQQWRGALLQADDRIALLEREAIAVALDQRHMALAHRNRLVHMNSSSITRMARGVERKKSSVADPFQCLA